MPTWHPAALLRDENKKLSKDLKKVLEMCEELEKNRDLGMVLKIPVARVK